MTTQGRLIGLTAALAVGLAYSPSPRAHRRAPALEGQTYVTVIDSENRPVLGLSQEDFSMRDGAVRQAVAGVEAASSPLTVAVVIEGFTAAEAEAVTRAVDGVARRLRAADPQHRLGMATGSGASRAIVPITSGVASAVQAALSPSAPRAGLIEALADACRMLGSAPNERRTVLALTKQPAGRVTMPSQPELTDALLLGKVAVWVIDVGGAATSKAPVDRLLADAAELGGALRQTALSTAALTEAASRVADLLVSQYLVTYTWPNPLFSQVTIALRHDRGVVLAPVWMR